MLRETEQTHSKNDKRILERTFDPLAAGLLRLAKKQPDRVRKELQDIKKDWDHYKMSISRPYNAALGVIEASRQITGFAETYVQAGNLHKGIVMMEASFGIQALIAVLSSSENLLDNVQNTYLEVVNIPEPLSGGMTLVPTLRDSTLKYLKTTEEKRKQLFEEDKTGVKVIDDFASVVRKNFGTPGFRAGVEFAKKYYQALYPLTA